MKTRNILITGGKGYLGARIATYLSKFDSYNVTVTSRNNAPIENSNNVNVKAVDTAKDDLVAVLKDIDIVLHLAALDANSCEEFPIEAVDVNISDTIRWLDACSKSKITQFIYFSTVHVYGKSLRGEVDETTMTQSRHPYAITHKCAEEYVLGIGEKSNFKSHVFRLSNAFGSPHGEMKQWNLLIPDICRKAVELGKITLLSNPNVARDFITINDVCRTVHHFIENQQKIDSDTYNLCSGESLTILEIAEKIQSLCEEMEIGIPTIELLSKDDSKLDKYRVSNDKIRNTNFNFDQDYSTELKNLINYCVTNFKK
jgi:UDP-glucose 4-epimerase